MKYLFLTLFLFSWPTFSFTCEKCMQDISERSNYASFELIKIVDDSDENAIYDYYFTLGKIYAYEDSLSVFIENH